MFITKTVKCINERCSIPYKVIEERYNFGCFSYSLGMPVMPWPGNRPFYLWSYSGGDPKTVYCEYVLTIIHRSGGKYPPLSPTLRRIIVLVYTTQAE